MATSSTTSTTSLVVQPPFASQIRSLPTALGTVVNLQRGYMIWANPQPSLYSTSSGPLGDGRDMIRFLFNPSTVSTDYNVGNTSLQAAMLYQVPGDNGNLLAPLLMQTVSFSLYFDRTYELNYGGNSSAINDPAIIGCQADVYQFMQFTGVLATLAKQEANAIQGAANATVGSATNGTANAITTGGIMMMMPCYLFFGSADQQLNTNNSSTNFNAIASQMAFYGYISEWSVEYTHWTSSMVPIRCSIEITFTMLPNPPATTQSAIYKDLNKLGTAPYTVPVPYINAPAPSIINTTGGS